MKALFTRLGVDNRESQHDYMAKIVGHPVNGTDDLSPADAALVIESLTGMADPIDAAGAIDPDSIEVSDEPEAD